MSRSPMNAPSWRLVLCVPVGLLIASGTDEGVCRGITPVSLISMFVQFAPLRLNTHPVA